MTQIRADSSQTGGEGNGNRERYRMLQSVCKHTDRTLTHAADAQLADRRALQRPGGSSPRKVRTIFSQMDWKSKQKISQKICVCIKFGQPLW